jgi:hypothetical protein
LFWRDGLGGAGLAGMRGAVECGNASVAGGGRVAFQVVGDGPLDVLVIRPLTFSST